MKPSQAAELRRRLDGSLTDATSARTRFATDGSLFTRTPAAVLYPHSAQDVQTAVEYVAEQAAKTPGLLSLTARGTGSNMSGGALGSGLAVVFPARLNRIRQIGKDTISAESGMLLTSLQTVLRTYHRRLPFTPIVNGRGTVGGLVGGNGVGPRAPKYGTLGTWVKGLRVVLDDGSLIETRRVGRLELSRKKGLMTREGEIYRAIDGLIQDHQAKIREATPKTERNAAGYRLEAVKRWDGSFDLSQLFVGSQGTLGLVTEVMLQTAPLPSRTVVLVGAFKDLETLGEAVLQLRQLQPSALEMISAAALDAIRQTHPGLVEGAVPLETPAAMLLVEFDNSSHFRQNRMTRRAARILRRYATTHNSTATAHEQQRLWEVRQAVGVAAHLTHKTKPALPFINDACVPPEKLIEFLTGTEKLLHKHGLETAMWGSIGDGNLQILPDLDLAKAKGRKAILKLMDEFYAMVIGFGGTTSASQGDGIARAPYLEKLYGGEVYQVFKDIKQAFDPQGIFNPGIKLDVKKKDLEPLLRNQYVWGSEYDWLPEV